MRKKYEKFNFEENVLNSKIISILRKYPKIKSYSINNNFMYISFKDNIPRKATLSVGGKDTMSGQEYKQQFKDEEKIYKEISKSLNLILNIEDILLENHQIFIVSDDFFDFNIKKWNNK